MPVIYFILAIFIKKTDFVWPQRDTVPPPPQPHSAPRPAQGNTLKEKQKNEEPIHKEYFKAYNRLKGRKNRGSISTDKWKQQVAMIQD